MDKRIVLELRGKHPSMAKELDLSFCKSGGEIEGLTEEFENLEYINIEGSNITNLKNFPKLKNLKRIDLSGNRLSKGLEPLSECANLRHLSLNGNKIKGIEALEPLKSLTNLTHLDIASQNPPNHLPKEELRASIFKLLPSLQYLDGEDVDGNGEEDENVMNGNGGDEEDGDDELDGEEEEEEEDEDSDEGEPETELSLLYGTSAPVDEEEDDDSDEESDDEEEDDEEDSEEDDHRQSTRGKVSESTRGKKRKFEDDPNDGGV